MDQKFGIVFVFGPIFEFRRKSVFVRFADAIRNLARPELD